MKKILLIALTLSLASGMAIAQQKGGFGQSQGAKGNPGNSQVGNPDNFRAGNRGNPVDRMTEQLGLDEAQAESIAVIFEDMALLRDEERQRMHAVAAEIRESTHLQILDVLTPEQQVLFGEQQQRREELRQALEDMNQSRRGGGFGGSRGTGDCNG